MTWYDGKIAIACCLCHKQAPSDIVDELIANIVMLFLTPIFNYKNYRGVIGCDWDGHSVTQVRARIGPTETVSCSLSSSCACCRQTGNN